MGLFLSGAGRLFGRLIQQVLHIFMIGGQDQLLFGPGHSHIKDTQLLSQAVPADLIRDHFPPEGGGLESGGRIHIVDADAPVRIADQITGGVIAVKAVFLVQAADKADRKFKSLALMDGHDPDHVRVLIQDVGFSVIHLPGVHLVYIADELEEACISRLFKGQGLAAEHLQVGAALLSARQGRDEIRVPGIPDQAVQQLMDGHPLAPVPPGVQKFQEIPAFAAGRTVRLLLRLLYGGFIQGHVSASCPERYDLIIGKAAEPAAHGPVKRNILPGIINDPQHLHDGPDFKGGEIAGPGFHISRNPLFFKYVPELLIPAQAGPQEDHDIAVGSGPRLTGPVIFDRKMPDDLTDPVCHSQSLPPAAAQFRGGWDLTVGRPVVCLSAV